MARAKSNRKHGEGSFKKTPSGKWEGSGWVKEIPKRVYVTGETLKEARQLLAQKVADVRAGLIPARRAGVTFHEYATEQIRVRDVKPRSKDIYTETLENYLKPLHKKKLDTITPAMLRSVYADLKTKYSDTVRKNAHTVVRLVFRRAVSDGKLTKSPALADGVKPKVERGKGRQDVQAYTPEQTTLIIKAAGSVRYGEMVAFLIFTGLRRGEACYLRWKHVDFERRRVLVRGTRGMTSSAKGGIYESETPKTDKSWRDVPMMPEVVKLLTDYRERFPYDPEQYVFVTSNRTPIRPDVVREPLRLAIRDINKVREEQGATPLPLLKIHALRHTFVSIMASQGMRLEVISKWIGDDPTTVMRTYVHVFATDMEMPSLELGEFSREPQPG